MFTFERVEKKYLINVDQMEALLQLAQDRIISDQYGQYTISNLYYDSENDACIRWSIEKPEYKEKLRIRTYEKDQSNPTVFVELKRKAEGIVYKRRILTDYEDALRLCSGAAVVQQDQIRREIGYFVQFYKPIPKLYLAYDRRAFCGKREELRITFDRKIRFRTQQLSLRSSSLDEVILPSAQVLMEIKVNGAMPFWLSRILSILEIYPTSYSKYGAIYQELQRRKTEKETRTCLPIFLALQEV